MKYFLLFLLLISSSTVAFSKNKKEERKFNEAYRPQFHLSTEMNKMGNPISVCVKDSTYHLYFQQNPYNLLPGYINWSLATSSDLLKWDVKGLVIKQPETVTDSMLQVPLFGSVCPTENGFKAWINRWDDGIYMAESTDGVAWGKEVKTIGTEKLGKSESQVFWYEPNQNWVMIAFERETTTMYIYNSTDGIHWEKTFNFNYSFGYPNLFELHVDRKPDETLWVMATEKGTYMLGHFDGKSFKPASSVKRFNYSSKIGASTFFKDPASGKTIGVSGLSGEQLADLPSNGQLTFPMVYSLHEFENGVELLQQPIEALNTLHDKDYSWEEKKIYPGIKNNILKGVKGNELHLKATIDVMNCDQFGFRIRRGRDNEGTEFSYDAKNKLLNLLNSQFSYQPVDGKMEIEMLIDRSSLEVLIDGGRYAVSYTFAPSPEARDYELFTVGGEIMVGKMDIYKLNSVWEEE